MAWFHDHFFFINLFLRSKKIYPWSRDRKRFEQFQDRDKDVFRIRKFIIILRNSLASNSFRYICICIYVHTNLCTLTFSYICCNIIGSSRSVASEMLACHIILNKMKKHLTVQKKKTSIWKHNILYLPHWYVRLRISSPIPNFEPSLTSWWAYFAFCYNRGRVKDECKISTLCRWILGCTKMCNNCIYQNRERIYISYYGQFLLYNKGIILN